MKSNITIKEERISAEEYIEFLKRTDLGSQYPKERFYERIPKLMKKAHEIAGGEKNIAVYLIANENAIPFYEKLGMKKSDDVMQFNHIEWTEWTVGSDN